MNINHNIDKSPKPCTICGELMVYDRRIGKRFLTRQFCSRACYKTVMSKLLTGIKKSVPVWSKGKKLGPNPAHSAFLRKNPVNYWLGKKRDPATKAKMSENRKGQLLGAANHQYKHGQSRKMLMGYYSTQYVFWRKAVFQRDDYTCQGINCGIRGGKLEADHVLSFAAYPDLRFEVLNGRTLCKPCHRKTPTFGKRGDITALQTPNGKE